MSRLTLQGVALAVNGRMLLGPLDASIDGGKVLSVMGPSGSGKSTLLAFICGVAAPAISQKGRILLDDVDITCTPAEQRGLGILFQDDLLFPHLSVAANLAFGLRRHAHGTRNRAAAIAKALDSFGLVGIGPRDPATLSGGQRARVSLLRTMLSEPRALLLDEPFAHLDAQTRDSVRDLVFGEIRRRRLPALLVTHDETDAIVADGPVIRLAGAVVNT